MDLVAVAYAAAIFYAYKLLVYSFQQYYIDKVENFMLDISR